MSARLRPQAEADIQAIAEYIAADNPRASRLWLAEIRQHCDRLGEMPGMGAPRFHIRPNLRMFVAGSYLILYQQIGNDAEIVRVLHGAREWQDLF